jgi:hypothetical protein
MLNLDAKRSTTDSLQCRLVEGQAGQSNLFTEEQLVDSTIKESSSLVAEQLPIENFDSLIAHYKEVAKDELLALLSNLQNVEGKIQEVKSLSLLFDIKTIFFKAMNLISTL